MENVMEISDYCTAIDRECDVSQATLSVCYKVAVLARLEQYVNFWFR